MNEEPLLENEDRRVLLGKNVKEDFLHFIWKFSLYKMQSLITVSGNSLTVLKPGQHNTQSGPDFFNGLIVVDDQTWAGNIEIHLKSSDWYAHNHEKDENYDSVILHVVWEYDTPVFYSNQEEVPTLVLKNFIRSSSLDSYFSLFSKKEKWILCEDSIKEVSSFLTLSWLHRLYFERLEAKTDGIYKILADTKNDWEAVLFQLLAKSFGMKLNGDAFFNLASSFDYSVFRKYQNSQEQMEALLYGQAGFFSKDIEDVHFTKLKKEYEYMQNKLKLSPLFRGEFKFFRLRPNNFPTIRISQLVYLYTIHSNLFSKVIELNDIKKLYQFFDLKASLYWDTHYVFGSSSKKRIKKTSSSFADLLIINVILPIRYAYAKYHNKNETNVLEELIGAIKPEKNRIIEMYKVMGVSVDSALGSQGLLELKSNYCDKKRCLSCSIGLQLMQTKK